MKKTFRNHPSIIIENMGAAGIFIFGIAISNIRRIIDLFAEIGSAELSFHQLISAFLVILAALLLAGMQAIRWKKTTISYDDKSIEISRNTLNRTEKTYAIRDISNINLEQNIFEQIFGTCKLKIDTNTAVTADETDIKIVLKKEVAESFKREILETADIFEDESLHGDMVSTSENHENFNDQKNSDVNASTNNEILAEVKYTNAEINRHFIFSNFTSIVIAIAFFVGNIYAAINSDGINLALLIIIIPFIWGLIKDYQKYYSMKIARTKDKLIIQSGLTTKNTYEIPLKKISGIKIKQNMISRLFGLCMVEVINIGMGDSKEESSVILLVQKYDEIKNKLGEVLEEYSLDMLEEAKYQSKKAASALNIKLSIKILISTMIVFFIQIYIPKNIVVIPNIISICLMISVALYVADIIISRVLSSKTNALAIKDEKILIMSGKIHRDICIINKDKIQQIKMKNGPFSKKHKIYHGDLIIISNVMNRDVDFGYFEKSLLEKIMKK